MAAFKKILVTGGIRSGKSRYVQKRASDLEGERIFLATALPSDDEMSEKIRVHRKDRGESFQTIEEPVFLAKAIEGIQGAGAVIVIDCVTIWINNLFDHFKGDKDKITEQLDLFYGVLERLETSVIIVTNEVGMGIIPDNRLAREYMSELGFCNQRVAQICDELILMVSGMPQWVKGQVEAPHIANVPTV